jgi:hypothetical protein
MVSHLSILRTRIPQRDDRVMCQKPDAAYADFRVVRLPEQRSEQDRPAARYCPCVPDAHSGFPISAGGRHFDALAAA